MSEAPRGLWSGLPPEGPSSKPLTYAEREALKVLLRFRNTPPSQAWMLWRAFLTALILLPFMAFIAVIPTAALIAVLVSRANDPNAIPAGIAIGVAICLGLTFGMVVRDNLELRQWAAVWPTINRVMIFEEIERLFQDQSSSEVASATRTETSRAQR